MYLDVKKIAVEMKISVDYIGSDSELSRKRILIRPRSSGVLIVRRNYQRGTDLKFAIDSFVIVTFKPDNQQELLQMIGRSSRQNKQHRGALVCTSNMHTEETLIQLLKLSNTTP